MKHFKGYLKFFGPSVQDGRMNVEKAGNSIIALGKAFQKYQKFHNQTEFEPKLGEVKKNCTEINIFFEQIIPAIQPVAETVPYIAGIKIADMLGVTAIPKKFFENLADTIMLKIFSKGKSPEVVREFIRDEKHYIEVRNSDGETKILEKSIYYSQKIFSDLDRLVQLEEGKEDRMEMGYYDEYNKQKTVAEIKCSQKSFFKSEVSEDDIIERLKEDFDEEKAKEEKVKGIFVDYYGLAHKYHFSFQARKNQDKIGKQKILCMVDKNQISEFIDLLKPENQKKNICIFGKSTRNREGKIDKMKISSFSLNEDFDPNQLSLI